MTMNWDFVSDVTAAQRARLQRYTGAPDPVGDDQIGELEHVAAALDPRPHEFEAGRASHTAPDASAAASRTAPAVRPSREA
ncbi:hypothetical protein AAH991_27195 [Microbispora sp. ZYX-F-249]|uniref:Uncharacterized protein n=1 Tax=Microbispora maris TaxID=3144104 RepID=A0ABV0AU60_9ACTN